MKSITTGTVSNKVQSIYTRKWKYNSDIRTIEANHQLHLFEPIFDNRISISLTHWESFIVFLAESFALAEAEASGKHQKIEITLIVDKE
jgi:hypothetical protein